MSDTTRIQRVLDADRLHHRAVDGKKAGERFIGHVQPERESETDPGDPPLSDPVCHRLPHSRFEKVPNARASAAASHSRAGRKRLSGGPSRRGIGLS
jgi:hypothetical protein